ncbi:MULTISPECIES: hypothetical protein [unclassified Thiocapsa]|uniref:hypothetical protein n=1 Tax=unclassified Thiocapsa TaxID=2641286 RepID=UPI0035B330B3
MAGRVKAPRHVSLVARFFIHSDPVDPFSITRLSIKLCDPDPRSLLDDPEDIHSIDRDEGDSRKSTDRHLGDFRE